MLLSNSAFDSFDDVVFGITTQRKSTSLWAGTRTNPPSGTQATMCAVHRIQFSKNVRALHAQAATPSSWDGRAQSLIITLLGTHVKSHIFATCYEYRCSLSFASFFCINSKLAKERAYIITLHNPISSLLLQLFSGLVELPKLMT